MKAKPKTIYRLRNEMDNHALYLSMAMRRIGQDVSINRSQAARLLRNIRLSVEALDIIKGHYLSPLSPDDIGAVAATVADANRELVLLRGAKDCPVQATKGDDA